MLLVTPRLDPSPAVAAGGVQLPQLTPRDNQQLLRHDRQEFTTPRERGRRQIDSASPNSAGANDLMSSFSNGVAHRRGHEPSRELPTSGQQEFDRTHESRSPSSQQQQQQQQQQQADDGDGDDATSSRSRPFRKESLVAGTFSEYKPSWMPSGGGRQANSLISRTPALFEEPWVPAKNSAVTGFRAVNAPPAKSTSGLTEDNFYQVDTWRSPLGKLPPTERQPSVDKEEAEKLRSSVEKNTTKLREKYKVQLDKFRKAQEASGRGSGLQNGPSGFTVKMTKQQAPVEPKRKRRQQQDDERESDRFEDDRPMHQMLNRGFHASIVAG